MAEFNLPKISIDPSKIKNRWGLGALGLVIWLLIAYLVVTKSGLDRALSVTLLMSTLLLLLFTLTLSFRGSDGEVAAARSPNILPSRRSEVPGQGESPEDIALIIRAIRISQTTVVRDALDKAGPSVPRKKNQPEN